MSTVTSFDFVGRTVLEVIEAGDDCPRAYREAWDDALQHGWSPDDCTIYAFAHYFYNLGLAEPREDTDAGA